jgi:maltose alpha-D-glucosyltransferase/alpha-amylase
MLIAFGCKSDKPAEANATEEAEITWYRNPFMYNIDVDAFKDSNGDGTGDFNGLTQSGYRLFNRLLMVTMAMMFQITMV